jgi:tripartite-type tricarboxylate transporter receptor subunit TctC
MMMYRAVGAVAILLLASFAGVAGAAQGDQFYEGKTVTLLAGTAPGNVYDLYARLLARHMSEFIPGHPKIIVQNVPGAASMIAANLLYNVTKPNGLTFGAIYPALYFDQVIGRPEVKYDFSKFVWLGSPDSSTHLLYMRADTPFKTLADVVNAKTPPKCGATGTVSTGYYIPKLLNDILGTKFDVVMGYPSGTRVDLAVQRGELECRAFTLTAYFAREPFFTWRKEHFVRVLIQTGRKRDPRLKDTPTVYEAMNEFKTDEAGRRLAELVLAGGDFGRPYVLPPKTPPERAAILRTAFVRALKSKGLLREAKRSDLEIKPGSAKNLAALAKKVVSQPRATYESMKKLLTLN